MNFSNIDIGLLLFYNAILMAGLITVLTYRPKRR